MNKEEAYNALVDNSYEWYIVQYEGEEEYEMMHSSELSNILQCGEPKEDCGIEVMEQCWNGEEIGESPF